MRERESEHHIWKELKPFKYFESAPHTTTLLLFKVNQWDVQESHFYFLLTLLLKRFNKYILWVYFSCEYYQQKVTTVNNLQSIHLITDLLTLLTWTWSDITVHLLSRLSLTWTASILWWWIVTLSDSSPGSTITWWWALFPWWPLSIATIDWNRNIRR